MELFNGKNVDWVIPSFIGVKADKSDKNLRLELYEKYNKIQNNYTEYPCDINVDVRIGTPSTMAQVFQITKNSIPIAAKILPICNDDSFENNKNEMEIAVKASSLVLSSNLNCFPIVYNIGVEDNILSSTLCQETYFYDKEEKYNWFEKSKRYQQFKMLLDNFSEKSKIVNKILSMKKQYKDPETIVSSLKLEIELTNKIQSHILLSELAYCDLGYYLNHKKEIDNPNEFYYNIIKDVLKAIEVLHTKLNVVHRDLHLGNILILENQNDSDSENLNPIILIHDFGKSKNSSFESYVDKVNDISYFMSQITDESKNNFSLPNKVKEYIDNCMDILDDNINMKYPIIKVVEFWESFKK